MIAFGASITRPDVYHACAEPGIRRAAEPDAAVYALPAVGSISRSYNALLQRAAAHEDLEALVLVHQDAEIVSPDLCATIRATLADRDVGLIGCVGAIGVRSIAWWEGSVTLASFINRYEEHGGGDLHSFSWSWDDAPPYARAGEVDTLDGFVLVLAPWVVRNLRFDEALGAFHGYDLDFCLQAREAGRRVVTADFRAIHHRPLEMLPDPREWIDAHIRVAEKWDDRMPRIGHAPGTWRERALRAEAERDAARADTRATALEIQARTAMLERALAETRGSISWRITAPLRLFKGRAAERPRLGADLSAPRTQAGRAR
jgi:Glycosyltransferase like family